MIKRFSYTPLHVSDNPAFREASAEELRVLLSLIEAGGIADTERIARAAGVSVPRVSSSLTLWQEAGVITEVTDVAGSNTAEKADGTMAAATEAAAAEDMQPAPTITEEFERRLRAGEIPETDGKTLARDIRDGELSSMIEECTALIGKATLTRDETARLCALKTQFSLDEEFILALAKDISDRGVRLTVTRLVQEADKLIRRDIDTPEALYSYIKRRNETGEWERELMRLLGTYGRSFSPSEKKFIGKWCGEFGYGSEIIGEAYDITVMNTGKRSFSYMDKILTRWHDGGAKTVADCRALSEGTKAGKKPREKSAGAAKNAPGNENIRYTTFTASEALERAIARSYGGETARETAAKPETASVPDRTETVPDRTEKEKDTAKK